MAERWDRASALLTAVAVGALAMLVRLPALHQPLDRDLGAHAAIGAYLVRDGLLPYVDVVDNKQPLPYLVFAVLGWLAPYRTGAIRLAAMLVAAATAVVLVLAARRLVGPHRAAAAGVLWVLAGASRWVQGVDLNTEHLLALTGSAAVLVPLVLARREGPWVPVVSGVLLGLAALSKAPGVLLGAAGLLPLLTAERGGRGATVGWYALGATLPVAAVAAVYAGLGHLEELVYWNLTYNARYAVVIDVPAWRLVLPSAELWPVTVLVVAGLVVAIARLLRDARDVTTWTLLAWLIAAYVGAKLGRRDFPHYFASVVPPAALLVVLPLHHGRRALAAGVAVAALLAVPFAVDVAGQIGRSGDELAIRLYRPTQATTWTFHDEVGAWLRDHAQPDDELFVVGNEPGFYWSSGLAPATPYLLDMARQVRPDVDDDIAADLAADPPRFLVFPYGEPVWHPYVRTLEPLPYGPAARIGPVHVLELGG